MDYEILKFLVKCVVLGGIGGVIAGFTIPMIAEKIGVSPVSAFVVCAVAYVAWMYSWAKGEREKDAESRTALWQEAYKAGAEAALKQKAG